MLQSLCELGIDAKLTSCCNLSSLQVMLLEPSTGDKPLQWPVAYRGKPQYDSDARGVSVWPVNAAKLVSALGVLGGSAKPSNLQGMMGPPGEC